MKKVPSRRDFLRTIEETSTVTELVTEVRNRFALKKHIKEDQKAKRMIGKTGAFELPDATFYKKNLSIQNEKTNKNFVD